MVTRLYLFRTWQKRYILMANKIGIFGGTFSPMHLGHLAVAEAAVAAFGLDKVFVVPAKVNPFRTDSPPTLPDDVRLECVRITCADNSRLVPCDMELKRGGVSYAIDTVKKFHESYPNAELFWIMGADSLPGLPRWHNFEELSKLCSFIVYPRGGQTPAEFVPQNCRVFFLQRELRNVSSTEIRKRIKRGQTLEGLVCTGVVPTLMSQAQIL